MTSDDLSPSPMCEEGLRRASPTSAPGASLPCPGLGESSESGAQLATLSPTMGPADRWLPVQAELTWEDTKPRAGTLEDFLTPAPTMSPHRETEAQKEELPPRPSV